MAGYQLNPNAPAGSPGTVVTVRGKDDADYVLMIGTDGQPALVPAADLGGSSAAMMVMFSGPLVSRIAPAWRSVAAIQLKTIAAWLDEVSTADCELSVETDVGVVLASVTIPAGSTVASKTMTTPIDATLMTPLIARLSIPAGQTGRNAMLVVTG
jgi:hypothetical protein